MLLGSGTSIDLSIADDNALAGAKVRLDTLTTALNQLGVGTDASSALSSPVSLNVALQALGTSLRLQSNGAAADAVDKLRAQTLSVGAGGIKLGDMILADTRAGPLATSQLNVLDLVSGTASLFNATNVANLNQITIGGSQLGLGTGVPTVQLAAVVIQPATFVCGPQGTTFYSANMRVRAKVALLGTGVDLTVPLLASVKLNLVSLELVAVVGRASGTIQAIDATARTLTVSATPGIAELYLGSISDENLMDRTTPIDPARELGSATLAALEVQLLVVNLKLSALARGYAIGTTPTPKLLNYTGPYPQTLSATTQTGFLGTLVRTLLSNLTIQLGPLGDTLGIVGDVLVTLLNGVLTVVTDALASTGGILAPVLDAVTTSVLDPLLSLLGVKLGEVAITAELPTKTPAGTGCNDGKFCTQNDVCSVAGVCAGTNQSCSDGISCTVDACDEANARCTNTLTGSCLINGACFASGTTDPSNPCRECTPATSTSAWSLKATHTACDDGLFCTTTDRCSATGVCVGTARVCDPAGQGCTSVCDEAADACRTGIAGCLIGSACVAEGSTDPSNPCRACNSAVSTVAYTNKPDATACSDGRFCTVGDSCSAGVCVGGARSCSPTGQGCASRCDELQGACVVDVPGCLIGGSCYAPGADEPGNPCRSCVPAVSTIAFTNKASGSTCSDGQFCTSGDACNGGGACVGAVRDCGDGLGCTADSCDESLDRCTSSVTSGCVIAGACVPTGADDPSNPCRTCNPTLSRNTYSNKSSGSACADGLFCTVGDACDGLGRCASTARSCDDDIGCTRDVCDESNDRCSSTVDTGCLINGVCRASNSDDPGNVCRGCDPSASRSGWTDKANGVTCSDAQYCTVGDACNGAGSCLGTARSCGSGGCSSVCDEAVDACVASGAGCSIGGICVAPNALDPGNPCRACQPARSTNSYTPLGAGVPCDDRLFCTSGDACDGAGTCAGRARNCSDQIDCTVDSCDEGNDRCVSSANGGCLIDGACIGAGSSDPFNPCRSCQPAVSLTSWSHRAAGYACDDGAYCTTGDACNGEGSCVGTPRDCNAGASGCARSCDELNDSCRADVASCTIDGACIAAGTPDPSNPCRECDPARSPAGWSVKAEGASCDDAQFCTVSDRCDATGHCLGAARDCDGGASCDSSCDEARDTCVEGRAGCAIGGACIPQGTLRDGNTCQLCDPTRSTSAWSPVALGATCSDGAFCTVGDVCDGSGSCQGTANPCSDGLDCTRDFCDEAGDRCSSEVVTACVIAGMCRRSGELDPGNACRSCNPSVSTTGWTNLPAAVSCDDGQFCTVGDGCDGEGRCTGVLRTCGTGSGCASFCDEGRDACRSDVAGCSIDHTCVAAGTSDPREPCRVCDPTQSVAGWSPRAAGSACDDGLACTEGDVCGSGGRCAGVSVDCSDQRDCTVDRCDEARGGCAHDAANSCLIGGACEPAGAHAPGNACLVCDPSRSPTSWSPGGVDQACDDGSFCTPNDRCDGLGRCVGTGIRCPDDGLRCTLESCHEDGDRCGSSVLTGCAISGECIGAGSPSTGNACLVCDPTKSDTTYSYVASRDGCDSDLDGLRDDHEQLVGGGFLDHDRDGSSDHLDPDDDGDSVPTRDEHADDDGDGSPRDARDLDLDGVSDYLDADDDGDQRSTAQEVEDLTAHGYARDVDSDGDDNWYDFDSDADGASDWAENALDDGDSNGDGIPDYLQAEVKPIDDDGDGIPSRIECNEELATCRDSDGDGVRDHLDRDDDGDSVYTRFELSASGAPTRNTDAPATGLAGQTHDALDDHLDPDDDGDGVPTRNEGPDLNGDGNPLDARDSDRDGTPNYLDPDDDGDGTPTSQESGDNNNNSIPDYLELTERDAAVDAMVWDAGVLEDAAAPPVDARPMRRGGLAGGGGCALPRSTPDLAWLVVLLVLR
ncbi:MAG: hypothetical protein ABW352_15880, partial [Polyangiales bacterium]